MNPPDRISAADLPPDVLYTSDLHGSRPLYEEALDLARRRRVRALLLGGDLAPHTDVEGQNRFYDDFLIPLLRAYRREDGSADIYYIFGNDDWLASGARFEDCGIERCEHVHGRVVPFLGGTFLAGLASVPLTPFRLKDWERWEEGIPPVSRWEGSRSVRGGAVSDFDFHGREEAESLRGDLLAIEERMGDGARVVCMFHGPPYGTACDQIAGGVHVGSRETRRFLERVRPLLGLHGHIHESPAVSGRFADRLGRTICVNPGQRLGSALHAVTFRIDDPEGTLVHTMLGPAEWGGGQEDGSH
ncbi:MAG TPA: metallophosphoesterase [Candidatus Eisenbacteria bacterium]